MSTASAIILWEKFYLLNKYLRRKITKHISANRIFFKTHEYPLVEKSYALLLQSCRIFNQIYEVIFFLYIVFNCVQCIFGIFNVLKGYSSELSTVELVGLLVFQALQICIVCSVTTQIEKQVQ